jgi:hypothetical protein
MDYCAVCHSFFINTLSWTYTIGLFLQFSFPCLYIFSKTQITILHQNLDVQLLPVESSLTSLAWQAKLLTTVPDLTLKQYSLHGHPHEPHFVISWRGYYCNQTWQPVITPPGYYTDPMGATSPASHLPQSRAQTLRLQVPPQSELPTEIAEAVGYGSEDSCPHQVHHGHLLCKH